jgi:CBS domain-containing protein
MFVFNWSIIHLSFSKRFNKRNWEPARLIRGLWKSIHLAKEEDVNAPTVREVYRQHGTAAMTLPANASLENLIDIMVREPSVRGIFLVDSEQRFAGMVTRVNLTRWAHLNLAGGKAAKDLPLSEFFRIIDARKAKDLLGGDGPDLSVREEDSLQSALDKMLEIDEDMIAVTDRGGTVLGDLRLTEILWWVITYGRPATKS